MDIHQIQVQKPTALTPGQEQRQKALKVATQFEEIFARQMVANLRNAADGDENGMFGKGVGSSTYASWFDNHLAHHVSNGGKLGVADTLMRSFERAHQIPTEQEAAGQQPRGGRLDAVV